MTQAINDQSDKASLMGVFPESKDSQISSSSASPASNQTTTFTENLSPANEPIMTTVPETATSTNTQTSAEPQFFAPSPQVEGVPPEQSPPRSGKNNGEMFKRVFIMGVLVVVLLSLGFVGFKVFGNLVTRNQPITLTYWGLWEDEVALDVVLNEYHKTHPTVEIVYSKQSPKQYRERLQAAISRGEGPDIFRFHNTWVPMFKDDLAPVAKTGYTAEEFKNTFYPVASDDLVISGKVYGVPLMIDGLGLYYNEDLLRAAGVTLPTTWKEFQDAAKAVRTIDPESDKITIAGTALGTVNNVEHFSDILAILMLQNDVNLKNPTSKEAQDALEFYRIFTSSEDKVWDETLDNSIYMFATGKVGFIFAPSWQVFTIKQINPQLNFQIIPIPQLSGKNVNWASYWVEGISAKSQHSDEAWEFLKFLTSKEIMVILYTEMTKSSTRPFGEPYSRVDLAQTIIADPYVGAYIRQAPTAKSFFLASRTFDNGINDRMIKYLENAINDSQKGVSYEQALTTATKGFQQVLSSYDSTSGQR